MEFQLENKLEISNLRKKYGEFEALKSISFEVRNKEFLSILGPSGCGKTTLLRILIGLLNVDEGTILKDGEDITNTDASDRGMGIVFQNYALFENMTAQKNVEYALKYHGFSKEEMSRKALEMLDAVDLLDHKDKYPKSLSGGQQQRVAIARTLALKPDVILFDEPMSALDVATRLSMRAELKRIQKKYGSTFIYVTHDQEEAFAMSDRIMVMDHGSISQIGTPDEIVHQPANDYVKEFVVDNLQTKIESLSRFTV